MSFFPTSDVTFNQCTYVINLKKRHDKKRLIEYKFSKMNIGRKEWRFFEAIDGHDNVLNDIYKIIAFVYFSQPSHII